jgi:hypothetical protein
MDTLRAAARAEADEGRVALAFLAELLSAGEVPDPLLVGALGVLKKVNGMLAELVAAVDEGGEGAPPPGPARR